jgi:hypothetical protein
MCISLQTSNESRRHFGTPQHQATAARTTCSEQSEIADDDNECVQIGSKTADDDERWCTKWQTLDYTSEKGVGVYVRVTIISTAERI